MKEFVFIFSLSLFIGLFVGCARTLTKNECLEANWYEIGRIDVSKDYV